jgi:chemotaxis protein MotB
MRVMTEGAKLPEGDKPFTKYASKADRDSDSPKSLRIALAFLAVASVALLLLWASAQKKLRDLDSARADFTRASTGLSNALAEIQSDQSKITALQSQVAGLEKEKDMAGQMAKGLEDEMRSDLESKDVTISNLQGKLTVNILDRVMFDSGEAVVRPGGEGVLRKIAEILTGHPELKIHVIGHTDNIPIHTARMPSNWELSTARALAAVHFLVEKAGVDPRRVGAVGYGEYRPIADNSTPEGRARNRRIAITILPDELAGADTVPTATTNVPVTPPPNEIPPK